VYNIYIYIICVSACLRCTPHLQESSAAAITAQQAAAEEATAAVSAATAARSEAEAQVQALQRQLDGMSSQLRELAEAGGGGGLTPDGE
jgi:chromosome segregation ATPase